MHAAVESKRHELTALCRRLGVRRLEVFGSAARGDDLDASTSNIDFLVVLPDARSTSPLDSHFGLKDQLEAPMGRQVDWVSDSSVHNPYVVAAINRDRQLLFAA